MGAKSPFALFALWWGRMWPTSVQSRIESRQAWPNLVEVGLPTHRLFSELAPTSDLEVVVENFRSACPQAGTTRSRCRAALNQVVATTAVEFAMLCGDATLVRHNTVCKYGSGAKGPDSVHTCTPLCLTFALTRRGQAPKEGSIPCAPNDRLEMKPKLAEISHMSSKLTSRHMETPPKSSRQSSSSDWQSISERLPGGHGGGGRLWRISSPQFLGMLLGRTWRRFRPNLTHSQAGSVESGLGSI